MHLMYLLSSLTVMHLLLLLHQLELLLLHLLLLLHKLRNNLFADRGKIREVVDQLPQRVSLSSRNRPAVAYLHKIIDLSLLHESHFCKI